MRRLVFFMYMCVFTRNMPRFHSQMNLTQAPAALVCAGSFISSPYHRTSISSLVPGRLSKTLIIAAATSEEIGRAHV